MYEGVIYVGGNIAELGNDAVIEKPAKGEMTTLKKLLGTYRLPCPTTFRKVVSGRKLWNFDRKELEIWKAAL